MHFKKVLGLVDLIKLNRESRYFLLTKRLYVRAKNKKEQEEVRAMTFSSAQKRTIIRSADRVSRSEISVSAVVVFRTALSVYWTLVPAWLTQDVTSCKKIFLFNEGTEILSQFYGMKSYSCIF